MVEAMRIHNKLEELFLTNNVIGNIGCDALATWLKDPNNNLRYLSIRNNFIGNEGATALANSLARNNRLEELFLQDNPIDRTVEGAFSSILCDTSSINDTYMSNHTLERLSLPYVKDEHLTSLLDMNRGTCFANKEHVAIRKIIVHHPDINMEPMFEWDADGEQTLKALPHVIDWFERAKVAIANEGREYFIDGRRVPAPRYNIEKKKLFAIFQFAKAMPLFFLPVSSIKEGNKKRKRG